MQLSDWLILMFGLDIFMATVVSKDVKHKFSVL